MRGPSKVEQWLKFKAGEARAGRVGPGSSLQNSGCVRGENPGRAHRQAGPAEAGLHGPRLIMKVKASAARLQVSLTFKGKRCGRQPCGTAGRPRRLGE